MASFTIKKGLDIKLVGAPTSETIDAGVSDLVTLYPQEIIGIRPRLMIREGDTVKRGAALFYDKRFEGLQFRSPACGSVKSIVFGKRRSLDQVVIQVDREDKAEAFTRYTPSQIAGLGRDEVIKHLKSTGYLALIRQRPFSKMANPDTKPKSIFVNAMSTAPYQPGIHVVIKGHEASFQAGLDVLKRLTEGEVHLCIDGRRENVPALTQAKSAKVHTFSGPHPSGNTSIHISRLDPIKPHDVVWTVKAYDVILIGRLFTEGEMPGTKIISLAGPGVKENFRKHYRVRMGCSLQALLADKLAAGEQRVIGGDFLAGTRIAPDSYLRLYDSGLTVIPEERERKFLGWMTPGLNVFSVSRTFLSRWFKSRSEWALNTAKHGSDRAMVLTGLYDRYVPMNIMVDYLLRASLAYDTDEAVQLGILETDPEDFALCSFICPSKMDVMGVVRRGLEDIEKEGI